MDGYGLKIIHIITRMILGGAQENTLLTCEGLHQRGHDVTLITGPQMGPEGELLSRAYRGGYRIIVVDHLQRAINPWRDMSAYKTLKWLLTNLDADIVHTHSAKGGILGRWAAAAVRKGSQDECCCRALQKLRQAQGQCTKPQIVHTIHGLAFHPYISAWKNCLYIAVERSAAKVTDAFISVAQAMTDQALAVGIGQAEQYTKVFSGLETDIFLQKPSGDELKRLRGELDINPEDIVVTCVARLAELKGHEYIIEAAKQLAKQHENVVWLFIGDGHWRNKIEKQIDRAGLKSRFRLSGLVSPQRVAELLQASDILVHCSLREGLARVLPQAMLCGKPVISFDIDGAREVVNDKTGFLLTPKDIAALIETQGQLIESRSLREKIGKAGLDYCCKEFDHHIMVDKIEKIYNNLLR